MTQIQWEYCALYLTSMKEHKSLLKGHTGWGYDCSIFYYSPSGEVIHQQISSPETSLDFNPFNKALAFLGGFGWELVNVQHGQLAFSLGGYASSDYRWDTLSPNNRIAYFKRPVIAGRAVNEPRLSIRS